MKTLGHLAFLLLLLFLGCKALGYMSDHGMTDPPPATSTESPAVPAAEYTTDPTVPVPPDPHFPCEDFSHGSPPTCTPDQAQVLIDRNCAQSRAEGDDCGIAVDNVSGQRYAYNIQSPAHAAASTAKAQEMSQKICQALTKDGGQCTVIDHD